jgi:di/tricarboxylate transporter
MDFLAIDWHAIAVLGIAGLTFWLFASERLPVQTTALLAVLGLMLVFGIFPYAADGRQLGPEVFLAGFGHTALITICCLMVLGRGLVTTGALEPFARALARLWNLAPQLAFLAMLVFCMSVSGVMNNTPLIVLMMPVLLSVAARTSTKASNTLMSMNYAGLIGGMATTIGTSTNLLVVDIAANLGVPAFGLFDFTRIVAIAAAVALPYLWLVAPRLLPTTETGPKSASPLVFDAVLDIRKGSYADGRELRVVLKRAGSLRVLKILRAGRELMRLPTQHFQAGDRLMVADTAEQLREHSAVLGAALRSTAPRDPGDPAGQKLSQVLITQESEFTGTQTGVARFVNEHRVAVIGVHRPGREEVLDPATAMLKPGDVLLVQGPGDRVDQLKSAAGVLVLDASLSLPHTRMAPVHAAHRLPALAGGDRRTVIEYHHDRGCEPGPRRSTERDRYDRCSRRCAGRGRRLPAPGPDHGDADAVHVDHHQLRVQQCRRHHRHAGRHRHGDHPRRGSAPVRPGRPVWLQPELRDTDGLPDEPAGHGRSRLPVQ